MSLFPGNAMARSTMGSDGMRYARLAEGLGLPSNLAQLVGASLDARRGDLAGVQRLLQAATAGISTGQMDALMGAGLPPMGHVDRPSAFFQPGVLARHPEALVGFAPFGGTTREAPLGTGRVGRSMERAMVRDPLFKSAMEAALGGRIIPDGRADGRFTVWRPPHPQVGGLMRYALATQLLPRQGLAAQLAGLSIGPGSQAAQGNAGVILGGLQRLEANAVAFRQQGAAGAGGALQDMGRTLNIDPSTASFEDLLYLMLMTYTGKKEREIMTKVNQLSQDGKGVAGAGSTPNREFMGGVGGTQRALDGADGDPSKMSETAKQQALQKLMGDLQKLYEMLSNILKSMDAPLMTSIRNMKG